MSDKRQEKLQSLYSFLGKCIVYSGGFCILFYLFGKLFGVLEPYVHVALVAFISNIQSILITLFSGFCLIWIELRLLDVKDNIVLKRYLREKQLREESLITDLNNM